jgi:IS30 family transposase
VVSSGRCIIVAIEGEAGMREVGLPGRPLSGATRREIRRLLRDRVPVGVVAVRVGCSRKSVQRVAVAQQRSWLERAGSGRCLSRREREEIACGVRAGESLRLIARRLGRSASTVSREVGRNGGRVRYRGWRAERAAWQRARRPKRHKLAADPVLWGVVRAMLEQAWSPQQVSARLRVEFPHDDRMRISHEAIYQALYVQGRGALRNELSTALRSGRARRLPRGHKRGTHDRIKGLVPISERPAEADDRAVPGHWEGDLILGKDGASQIGTLVERSTRFLLLVELRHGRTAELVAEALAAKITTLPEAVHRSLAVDRGSEMAQHAKFTVASGIPVYFCDPHSPWQRGSNENTNGLLRQYFPKGTSLRRFSQAELDAVADQLNRRPRQTLHWKTPSEALNAVLMQ